MVTGDDGMASVKLILHASPFPLNFFLPPLSASRTLSLLSICAPPQPLSPSPPHPPPPPRDLDARLTKRGSSCYGDNHGTISIKEIELTSPHARAAAQSEQMAHSTNIVAVRREPTVSRGGRCAILNIWEMLFCSAAKGRALICPADE